MRGFRITAAPAALPVTRPAHSLVVALAALAALALPASQARAASPLAPPPHPSHVLRSDSIPVGPSPIPKSCQISSWFVDYDGFERSVCLTIKTEPAASQQLDIIADYSLNFSRPDYDPGGCNASQFTRMWYRLSITQGTYDAGHQIQAIPGDQFFKWCDLKGPAPYSPLTYQVPKSEFQAGRYCAQGWLRAITASPSHLVHGAVEKVETCLDAASV